MNFSIHMPPKVRSLVVFLHQRHQKTPFLSGFEEWRQLIDLDTPHRVGRKQLRNMLWAFVQFEQDLEEVYIDPLAYAQKINLSTLYIDVIVQKFFEDCQLGLMKQEDWSWFLEIALSNTDDRPVTALQQNSKELVSDLLLLDSDLYDNKQEILRQTKASIRQARLLLRLADQA